MIGIHVTVLKHLAGPEYCILEFTGKDELNTYKSSFSFSLKYLFDYVLPEHHMWFLNQVVEHYLTIEMKKINILTPIGFEIKNGVDVLVHCSSIYKTSKKTIASEK